MAADFSTAEAFGSDFITMTHEGQLQYLQNVSDKLRGLRRQVLDVQAASTMVDNSTRTWSGPVKADFKEDLSAVAPANGQTVTVHSKAEDLWDALDAIA